MKRILIQIQIQSGKIMKYIITEEQLSKFIKGNPNIDKLIVKYMNGYMNGARRKIIPKSRNYGDLTEIWCKNNFQILVARYSFGEYREEKINDDFQKGHLSINKDIITTLSKLFSVRKNFIVNSIIEWYDETYTQKFAQEMNEPYLHIDDAEDEERIMPCPNEIIIPKDITNEEMIDYIAKNTLYTEDEIIKIINNGEEELKDMYLHVREIKDRND